MFKPYSYTKKYPFDLKDTLSRADVRKLSVYHWISSVLIIIGLYLLVGRVLYPIALIHAEASNSHPIIDPLGSVQALSIDKQEEDMFSFKELNYSFREGQQKALEPRENIPDRFYLTIPKLDIYDAIIETNAETLDPADMLGHYHNSCLPDEDCNVFIYGHSTHKWVKNKYETGDYTAIFSRLDELEYGDELFINFNNKEYRYIVDSSIIRKPEDVDPLAQPYPKSIGSHESTIELFTCAPAGSTKYRLSIIAKQID